MSAEKKDAVRELFCSCGGTLVLHIKMEEEMTAQLIYQYPKDDTDDGPCFAVDFDKESKVEYFPYFICSKCKVKCYTASQDLEFDEDEEMLIFPSFNEDTKLGYSQKPYNPHNHQYPFAPDNAAPKEEKKPDPPAPALTIKRASAGETIEPSTVEESGYSGAYLGDWYGMCT